LRAADAQHWADCSPATESDAAHPLRSLIPGLIAVSAHQPQDLEAARRIGADFAVLGHVFDTPSHPGVPGMGRDGFATLTDNAGLPVFAIGGQSAATLADARRHGAHGIAGIRGV